MARTKMQKRTLIILIVMETSKYIKKIGHYSTLAGLVKSNNKHTGSVANYSKIKTNFNLKYSLLAILLDNALICLQNGYE